MAKRKTSKSSTKSASTAVVMAHVAEAVGTSKSTARAVLAKTAEVVAALVGKGHRVNLRGLGIYYMRKVKAVKGGRREVFGKMITVKAKPARMVPKVRLPKLFKDRV